MEGEVHSPVHATEKEGKTISGTLRAMGKDEIGKRKEKGKINKRGGGGKRDVKEGERGGNDAFRE